MPTPVKHFNIPSNSRALTIVEIQDPFTHSMYTRIKMRPLALTYTFLQVNAAKTNAVQPHQFHTSNFCLHRFTRFNPFEDVKLQGLGRLPFND